VRSAAVLLFIVLVAAAALFCAQKPTVARGDALAASLMESNPLLSAMECDREVPIGMTGATFACKAHFKNGNEIDYTLAMDRAGTIRVVEHGDTKTAPRIKKTTDPWGD
jgi:hypothetical protein